MLSEIKDYLKTLNVAEHYSVGKIENSKQKSLGVYSDSSTRRVEAIGRNSSYGTLRIRLLLHWNKSAVETEEAARELFSKIRYIQDLDLTESDSSSLYVYIEYIEWDYDSPVFVGTDDNGVFEYVISGIVFYRR